MSFETITSCRSCGSEALESVLSLGDQPLANSLVPADRLGDAEPRFPLTLAVCRECSLGQILETVPPQDLFSDYLYFSSYSDGMLAHARESTAELVELCGLDSNSLVVEVASNDGYQLQYYREAGVPVLGIEPAANIAKVAEEKGIPSLVEFFEQPLATRLVSEGRKADVILGYNVLAHVPEPNSFVGGLSTLLKDDGIVVIEVPDAGRMLEICAFDTIYHEHLSYFSLTSLCALFGRHGLDIFRVAELPIHGGSLRLYAGKSGRRPVESTVESLLERERARGMADTSAWLGFAERVKQLRTDLVALVKQRLSEGRRVAAYGAAAKGSTLLNFFGLDASHIEFVADRSPHKQGLHMPGVRIPIRDAASLEREKPDDCILLAWNFADEIREQQKPFADAGGKFIVPLPHPKIV